MEYTKKQFAAELILILERNKYNISNLANWANKKYYEQLENIRNEKLKQIILDISAMSSDPQFEYTEQELIELAINLIKDSNQIELKTFK